jgi:4-amino-4-deoxy-L-arabinose transferase-like glycosyltransferase
MSRFGRLLLLIVIAGLAVRVGYVAFVVGDDPLKGDQVYYTAQANRLAQGYGFVEPYDRDLNVRRPGTGPSAEHPPLTSVVLAPVSWVANRLPWVDVDTRRGDIHGPAHRFTLAIIGSLGIALVGLLGREVRGDRVGLIAAGIAAVYPNLWVNDGLVMSETLTVVAVALVLYLTYRYRRAPTVLTGVGLGMACGLAALTRAEMLLLVPCIALPAVLLGTGSEWRSRLVRAAAMLAAVAIIVGPWIVFNLTRFEDPTFLSTNDGSTLLGANCDASYFGPATGLWQLSCLPDVPGDRSQVSTEYRRRALDFIESEWKRVPEVVLIRVGRLWNLYRPIEMAWYNDGEGREIWISRLGIWTFYPLSALAIAGVVVLRRSWSKLWPLVVLAVIVTFVGAATYGLARFRAPAELSMVVLAAVAIDAALRAVVSSTPPAGGPDDALRANPGVPAGSSRFGMALY